MLRTLGGDTWMTAADGLIGIVGSIVAGSILAVVVATALSPLSPIGPVRPVYPDPGISFDWSVLGLGMALFIIGLAGASVVLAIRNNPVRLAKRASYVSYRPPLALRAAAASGLPRIRGGRVALCAGAGTRQVVRSNPFGHVRSPGGRSHGGLHPYVRQQPADTGCTTQALRVELGPMPYNPFRTQSAQCQKSSYRS